MFENIQNYKDLLDFENPEEMEKRLVKESEISTEIKLYTSLVAKRKFENILPIKKEFYVCLKNCYEDINFDKFNKNDISKLENCIKECKNPLKDLKIFFSNINYLSEKKYKNCQNNCENGISKIANHGEQLIYYYNCSWSCYTRLENRYKEYWLKQRNDIIRRHKNKDFDQISKEIDNYKIN